MPRSVRRLLVAAAAVAVLAGPAAAQDMTTSDVTRLETTADQIGADILKLRQRDRTAARAMQAELTDLEDEITYLKVKMRKERVVSRSEYMDVRDRLENLRGRVTGNDTYAGRYETGRGTSSTIDNRTSTASPGTVPSGTEIDVRLVTALSSD